MLKLSARNFRYCSCSTGQPFESLTKLVLHSASTAYPEKQPTLFISYVQSYRTGKFYITTVSHPTVLSSEFTSIKKLWNMVHHYQNISKVLQKMIDFEKQCVVCCNPDGICFRPGGQYCASALWIQTVAAEYYWYKRDINVKHTVQLHTFLFHFFLKNKV